MNVYNRRKESGVETVPYSVMEVEMIQEQEVTRRMFVLFDSGSTNSYITKSELPKNLTPNFHNQAQEASTTLGGETSCNCSVT